MKNLFILTFVFFSTLVSANTGFHRPHSFVSFSPQNNFVFVFWVKNHDIRIEFPKAFHSELRADEFLHSRYPETGLYEVKTRKLLWKYSSNSILLNALPSTDGQYVLTTKNYAHGEKLKFELLKNGIVKKEFSFNPDCIIFLDSASFKDFVSKIYFDTDKNEYTIDVCGKTSKLNLKSLLLDYGS